MRVFLLVGILTFSMGSTLSAQQDASGARIVSPASGEAGAAIDARFAECAGAPCLVKLVPAKAYTVTTRINIPAAMGQVLDCQGATLLWSGTGDEIEVDGLNGDSPSGEIRNCTLQLAPGNASGRNGVHQQSRIWMSYRHDTFQDWTNPASAGLVIDNTAGVGWPGYNERTHIENVSFSNDTTGLRLIARHGGTESFARSAFVIECNEHDGQTCFSGENGADIYSASPFILHGNLSSNTPGKPAALLVLSQGSDIRTTNGFIEAECAGRVPSNVYDLKDINAKFQLTGGVWNLGGCTTTNAGTSDNALGTLDPGGFKLQTVPYANGLQQANNVQIDWNGTSWRQGIPSVGGYPRGSFQIYTRVTDANPEVDFEGDKNSPQLNIVNCVGLNTHTGQPGGCGFGPGFGLGATVGGTLFPHLALETSGGFAVREPGIGTSGGVSLSETIDPHTGTLDETFYGGSQGGQPSFARQEVFYDFTTYRPERGMSRFAVGGVVHYSLPTLKLGSGPELTGVQGIFATKVAGASGNFNPGDLVKTDEQGDFVDAGKGVSADIVIGACRLSVKDGLIVAKSGC
jgi:hypothetical protein